MIDYLYQVNGVLDKKFCSRVIKKFEKDENKYQGIVGGQRVDLDVKQSMDLHISGYKHWEKENQVFYNSLKQLLNDYYTQSLSTFGDGKVVYFGGNYYDTGYQVQRTSPGGFYHWHNDFKCDTKGYRCISVIWYLNDVKEGGYTEFYDGRKVQPEAGKAILFPSTWDFIHRGYPPKSENKYICTGWMHSSL